MTYPKVLSPTPTPLHARTVTQFAAHTHSRQCHFSGTLPTVSLSAPSQTIGLSPNTALSLSLSLSRFILIPILLEFPTLSKIRKPDIILKRA